MQDYDQWLESKKHKKKKKKKSLKLVFDVEGEPVEVESSLPTFLEYVKIKSLDKKKLDKIGDYRIYSVNASAIRNTSQGDDEFNHFATHLEFPDLVPNNEIWISRDIAKREIPFLIHNGINQYEGKKKGKKWYDYALKKERAEREKVDHLKFKGRYDEKTPPDKVYYKYYWHPLA